MMWRAIGQSVTGSSHISSGRGCEDALAYVIETLADGSEALICYVSDGAGSAAHAAEASQYTTQRALELTREALATGLPLIEGTMREIAEQLYDGLVAKAAEAGVAREEYSCTLLGCVLLKDYSVFLQIGDGAIILEDGQGGYVTRWWPQNGEYSNTTYFLIDDPALPHLQLQTLDYAVNEVALTTDGLQQLVLVPASMSVHRPFLDDLLRWLRLAQREEDVRTLDRRLGDYLGSERINARTDDDKTLFLATRIGAEGHV